VTTILAFVFVIGVLVFVHELGHYLAARRVGVRVLTFSVGFGPRVLGFTRGGTQYCVSAIPLGGYVKMAGETAEEGRTGQPDEFLSKSKWERFQILIMGPAMNILLAIVVLAIVLMQGAEVPVYRDMPTVVGAMEAGSPAERVGLQVGDRIVRVDDDRVENWQDYYLAIGGKANREVTLLVDRAGESLTVQVVPDAEGKYEIGDLGILPTTHPRVRSVVPGDPADKAGIEAGDVVVSVNGQTISFARQLSEVIGGHAEEEIVVRIERNGEPLEFRLTPVLRGDKGLVGIGINDETKRIEMGPLEALWHSVEQNWEATGLIFRTLGGLFTGTTSPKQLMGPVGIAQLSGESAESGWLPLLGLLASISLNLGLLNLLPIPILDGGHILIMLLEGIARRDFSVRMKERMLIAGFVFLMLLMVTVIYNDLTRVRWIENLMFWR
jgi:regulator of sigma E protease